MQKWKQMSQVFQASQSRTDTALLLIHANDHINKAADSVAVMGSTEVPNCWPVSSSWTRFLGLTPPLTPCKITFIWPKRMWNNSKSEWQQFRFLLYWQQGARQSEVRPCVQIRRCKHFPLPSVGAASNNIKHASIVTASNTSKLPEFFICYSDFGRYIHITL